MAADTLPDPKELEKELNDYLTKKYGNRIKLATPVAVPRPDEGLLEGEGEPSVRSRKIAFDLKPEELEAYLDQFVVKQDDAKEVLATKICTHFKRIQYREACRNRDHADRVGMIKNNIIMIGPTGVGKTYLIKLIAHKIGVPFVKGDATKFSETGYVGGDVEDLVRDLVREADGDSEFAQYGIIYIDEIDKIASGGAVIGIDVSRTGVQRCLLKPMEETEVDLKVPHDLVSQMEAMEQYRKTGKKEKRVINTRDILFIVSGAFTGLSDVIRKRVAKQGIGFGAVLKKSDDETDYLKMVTPGDLVDYGFESEFVGRLPVITVFDRLGIEDLYHILRNRNSTVVNAKKRDFRAYGIDLRFEDDALYAIAERACKHNTGARSLVSAVESILMKFEKKLPSTAIKRLVVTRSLVEDPAGSLRALLDRGESGSDRARYRRVVLQEKKALRHYMLSNRDGFPPEHRELLKGARLTLLIDRVVLKGAEMTTVLEEIHSLIQEVRQCEEFFLEESGIAITFDDRAVDSLVKRSLDEGTPVEILLRALLKNYRHGLTLIQEKNGMHRFVLGREALRDPEGYLDRLIQQSYSH
jgi:endopeptidase Clp ATP-binding regulatory subunit ClpX